jgi:hypothetical protein
LKRFNNLSSRSVLAPKLTLVQKSFFMLEEVLLMRNKKFRLCTLKLMAILQLDSRRLDTTTGLSTQSHMYSVLGKLTFLEEFHELCMLSANRELSLKL